MISQIGNPRIEISNYAPELKNTAVSQFHFGQKSVAKAQLDVWIFAIKLETLNCIIFYQEESHYFFVS